MAQLYIHILFDYGLSHNIEYSSLCCKYSEALLSIHLVYSSLHLLIPDSQPTLPPWQPQLCSSCLLTDFFFIFICTAAAAAATAVFLGGGHLLCAKHCPRSLDILAHSLLITTH